MRENQLQKKVIKYLRSLAPYCWFYKVHDAITFNLPDIIGCYYGVFFALELKSTIGEPTLGQRAILNKIEQAEGIEALIYHLDDAIQIMEVINAGHMA